MTLNETFDLIKRVQVDFGLVTEAGKADYALATRLLEMMLNLSADYQTEETK